MDWKSLGIQVLSYMLPVIAAVLTSLTTWGLSLLAKKWKIDLNLSQDAAIRIAIRAAIGGAEEWASRKLKLDAKAGVSGAEKAQWVIAVVEKQWPNLTPAELDRMIDEELSAISGVGATGQSREGYPMWTMVCSRPV